MLTIIKVLSERLDEVTKRLELALDRIRLLEKQIDDIGRSRE